ncbi:MAG: aminotransferase class I/II-fold pyridoxal phosphate-dependent enzyme [Candidatus Hodarchaeales archaeon]|jgi:aspartate/methionine/tyrosine aminotransferase
MPISIDDLNENVITAQYAVRGPIVARAMEMQKKGKEIIFCNIGNPQALGQKPFTYLGQFLTLLRYPAILDSVRIIDMYPKDLVERASGITRNNPNLAGKYSASPGVQFIRETVSEFIVKRDNIPSDPTSIFMTDGASKGVDLILKSIIKNKNTGIMIPIPQYPLYSADITLFGGTQVPYYLNEENGWQLDLSNLEESITKAKKEDVQVKAIVVINPNNPTGAVLSYNSIRMIVEFAKEHDLAIMADEVYQENIYNKEDKFYSLAKVIYDLQVDDVSLFSFHSASKGIHGECGARGGYVEMRNIQPEVKYQLHKAQSISLCSNLMGQLTMYAVIAPPEKGDESYDLYIDERDTIFNSLVKRSKIMGSGLDSIDGISCVIPQGAMYVFPKLDLPKADYQINGKEVAPDFHFCHNLLEEKGVCVVPGSGFGQVPGTHHFRGTILPPEEKIEYIVNSMKEFFPEYVKSNRT